MNKYIGHTSQLYGIEEHRLVGGKGDGMRLLELRNGQGLEMTVSLDRASDISRLRYKGINLGYFSPCGYAAPAYYESDGNKWLKTFTAGFLTTCGLQSIGTPCVDQGEELPLHGSISNIPAEAVYWKEEDGELIICSEMNDEGIFSRKLRLHRKIAVSLSHNRFRIQDEIHNTGDREEPLQILYHMNMGYPLLDEDAQITITSESVRPRDKHAEEDIDHWMKMEKPQKGYVERCYYHECTGEGKACIYQPKSNVGLQIGYHPQELDCFTEWKMMGERDYVLGLECGNSYPDGRNVMREQGKLKYIGSNEKVQYNLEIEIYEK